jgi:hypothetical protein
LSSAESVLGGGPESAQASSLFAPGVKGRISPLGEANDLTQVRNYFFGVVGDTSLTQPSAIFRVLVPRDDRVWVEVDIAFQLPSGLVRIRQVGFFRFNANNQIVSFDLTMPNYGAFAEANGVDVKIPAVVQALANQVCQRHNTYCASSPQYVDVQDCMSFLLQTLPVATYDRVNSNSIVCRVVHAGLTPFTPDSECPNLGPSGGSECQDFPYDNYFTPIF